MFEADLLMECEMADRMEVRDQMSMPGQLWTAYSQPVGFWVSESQTNCRRCVQVKGGSGGSMHGTQKKQTSTQTQSHEEERKSYGTS